MEKNLVKIDSWEPAKEKEEFKYPRGKERPHIPTSKEIRDSLLPELIKALDEGISEGKNKD